MLNILNFFLNTRSSKSLVGYELNSNDFLIAKKVLFSMFSRYGDFFATLSVIKEYEKQYNTKIPVIVAGGIFDSADIAHALELGADGVQIASRFVATEECDASDAYKQAYIHAREEDIQIIQSPVGMPGRALRNEFIKNIEQEHQPIKKH